jgi:PPOX class probable F420-dependent enzyme
MTVAPEISNSSYVSLTTYRKDGTGVPTPVWHAMDGDTMVIISGADAWKVKRVRRDSHVMVTVCDIRGRIAPGAPSAEGTAAVLDEAGTQVARDLIARKYVMSRLGNAMTKLLRLRRPPVIAIAVTFA